MKNNIFIKDKIKILGFFKRRLMKILKGLSYFCIWKARFNFECVSKIIFMNTYLKDLIKWS